MRPDAFLGQGAAADTYYANAGIVTESLQINMTLNFGQQSGSGQVRLRKMAAAVALRTSMM